MTEEYRDTCTDEPFKPEDLPVQVCMSAAGYYIGQLEPCGAPFSRLSGYFKTRAEAEKALDNGWKDRGAEENKPVLDALEKAGKLNKIAP
jgi:hypothetical protein